MLLPVELRCVGSWQEEVAVFRNALWQKRITAATIKFTILNIFYIYCSAIFCYSRRCKNEPQFCETVNVKKGAVASQLAETVFGTAASEHIHDIFFNCFKPLESVMK